MNWCVSLSSFSANELARCRKSSERLQGRHGGDGGVSGWRENNREMLG